MESELASAYRSEWGSECESATSSASAYRWALAYRSELGSVCESATSSE
jgi:hypothetical protein